MTIATLDQLVNAMGNNTSRIVIDKTSINGHAAGNLVSLWRATGVPAVGNIPAAAALCTNATLGAIGFTQQTNPATSYFGQLFSVNSLSAMVLEIRDRLAEMGGLNGTLITAQTVGLDLSTTGGGIAADRRGDANYSDVQWFLEWYTATGATVVNATVNVTYDDASTGNLAVISLAATRPAGLLIPLIPAVNGRFIRGVNSVTLSATTGTAGSFGVTATRLRAIQPQMLANLSTVFDWQMLGLTEVPNGSCLMLNVLTSTTSSGAVRGGGKIIYG